MRFRLTGLAVLLAIAAIAVLMPGTNAQTNAEPTWNSNYSTITLQVGSNYEFSLAPTLEECNSAYIKGLARAQTLTAMSGTTAQVSPSNYGFHRRRNQGTPFIPDTGTFGPILGISLEIRGNELYVVGTPLRAATGMHIWVRRTCIYSERHHYLVSTGANITFAGSGTHSASAHSVAHGHHHPEYALGAGALTQTGADSRYSPLSHTHAIYAPATHAHTGYAISAHTHPAPDLSAYSTITHAHTGFVAKSAYDALLARVTANEFFTGRLACRDNPNAFWNTALENPHSLATVTHLRMPEAVRRHCCIAENPDQTEAQCFMTAAQRAQLVLPLPPAPEPKPELAPTSP